MSIEVKTGRETMGNSNGDGKKGTESESQGEGMGGSGNWIEAREEEVRLVESVSESHFNYASRTLLTAPCCSSINICAT